MKSLGNFPQIFLCQQFVDFRKGINGLSQIVQSKLGANPMCANSVFVFCNKSRDKIRLIYWDQTGFALWHKQLENAKFNWPKSIELPTVQINSVQIQWLLSGIDIEKIQPHKAVEYDFVG